MERAPKNGMLHALTRSMSTLPTPAVPAPAAAVRTSCQGKPCLVGALMWLFAVSTCGSALAAPEDAQAGKSSKASGIQAFDLKMLDRVPTVKFQARPEYPVNLRKAGVTGEVVVDFIVDIEGNVVNAFALRSTQKEFEAPAVAAVSQWKFKPGEKGGRKVHTHMQVPIVFSSGKK